MKASILFTSAGRRVGLINCFRVAARELGVELRILAADLVPQHSAACQVADASFKVPRVTDPNYTAVLKNIALNEGVSLIVPTIDTELSALARVRAEFEQRGVRIQISSEQFVEMCRDKLDTARYLFGLGLEVPKTWVFSEVQPDDLPYPVIAKPRSGSSSIGIEIVRDMKALMELGDRPNYILQEFLNGPEFTINTFYDVQGVFRAAIPHRRLETRGGEMSKGITIADHRFTDMARLVGSGPAAARGVFCFQAIMTDSGPKIFEVNARFGGGYPLADRAGGHFARWLMEEVLDLPSTANDQWQAGLTCLRYDSEVFLG